MRGVIDRDVCGNLVSEIGLFGASQTAISHANLGAMIETPIYRWGDNRRREAKEREHVGSQTAEREELQALPNYGMF